MLAALSPADQFLFIVVLIGLLLALICISWFSWRLSQRSVDPSPYTGLPLRRGGDIRSFQAEKIYKFLLSLKQYDNPLYDLNKAAFCRDTGRIFANAINIFDCIRVDWNFLQKRFRGHYVSWGSLTEEQQQAIRKLHSSLDGFQTEFSSPEPIPRLVEPQFAYTKPGPLYVDVTTNTLVGWKIVPETEFEVLIVQKPLTIYTIKPE